MAKYNQNEIIKLVCNSEFKELQPFTDLKTGHKFMTMTLETWEFLKNKYNIPDEKQKDTIK